MGKFVVKQYILKTGIKRKTELTYTIQEINDIDFSKMDGKAVLNRAIKLIVS